MSEQQVNKSNTKRFLVLYCEIQAYYQLTSMNMNIVTQNEKYGRY